MDSARSRCFKQVNIMKIIYITLRSPAVLPEGVFKGVTAMKNKIFSALITEMKQVVSVR